MTATRVQELLQNSRRRHVVDLIDEYGALAIGELAERVAARETGVDPEQVPSDDRKRVYVGLYQCHLDKLDEADVVEYDKRGGLVEAGPELSGVAGVMHAVEARTGGESA
ncbi:hypothetical protein BRC81_02885 [Halobacteriales archaeon QS_1_68_20]|nr:MAG: hypothetical protein BRC81_02885 [Halobacteriales archaeon QS_1_68_20]